MPHWRTPNLTSGAKVHLPQVALDGNGHTTLCGAAARARGAGSWRFTHEEVDCPPCLKVLARWRPQFGTPQVVRHRGYTAFIEATWRATDDRYRYEITETRQPRGAVLEARLHVYEHSGRQAWRLVPLRANREAALAAALWAAYHRPGRRPRLTWRRLGSAAVPQWIARDPAGRTYTLTHTDPQGYTVVARQGKRRLWTWTYDTDTAAMAACATHAAGSEPKE